MSETEFLMWVRGPAFQLALFIFVAGSLVRIIEILSLGRKPNLATPRGSAAEGGIRTLLGRTLPAPGSWNSSTFTITAGYLFHIGLLLVIFLFAPHILVIEELIGAQWPGLPIPIIDAATVITMIALLAILFRRITDPVLKLLSTSQDFLVWAVTFLPMLTGYLAFHRLLLPAPTLLAIHILSVELLMVLFPFTKLMHTFSLILARWYTGAIAGYKGIKT